MDGHSVYLTHLILKHSILYRALGDFNSSVVGCFRKLGVVGCVPYGTQGFLSSLGESSGLFLNKMDRVLSDVSLDTKMEVRYVQYD